MNWSKPSPALQLRWRRLRRWAADFRPTKKIIIIASGVLVLAIGGIVFAVTRPPALPAGTVTNVNGLDFPAVLPTGKTAASLGGLKPSYPDGNAPVYAYSDSIENIAINVSQQALPESFKGDIDAGVAQTARNFNATNTMVAEGLTAYIGTSSKGPQSVIFAKGETLVLIKSDNKISGPAWVAYIDSLK